MSTEPCSMRSMMRRWMASGSMLVAFLTGLAAQEPAPDIPTLIKTANVSYMRGDYEAARLLLVQSWELAQQTPTNDPIRYDVLKRLTSVRSAVGEFADADNYLQMAINW